MSIRIRAYETQDREKIIALTKRLSDFELQEFRQAERVDQTNIANLKTVLAEPDADNAIFVAEVEGSVVGYIHLQTQSDYFSGEKHGYIAKLAVGRKVEGRGIGRKLLEQAEAWTREKGYERLKLHVFAENWRALQIYEKYGYEKDVVQYVKKIA